MTEQRIVRNQENLRRSVSLPQAIGVAFHQVVGAGVISLTGVAIALTGGGVSIAYLLAAISIVIVSLPYAAIGSALPVTGGMYSYTSRFIHPAVGYFIMCIAVLGQTSLGLYGLAAGVYLHSLNPWFDQYYVAAFLITFFFLTNLKGAALSTHIGLVLMAIMLVAFTMFFILGLPHVNLVDYPPMMPNGALKLLQAAATLTFATGGALIVVELGGELRNPGRAIPISILGGTFLAVAIYVAIAFVAAGVLPIAEVANQPLSVVAKEFMPLRAWQFFILGGAMVSVIGTINAQMLTGSKSLLAAIDDGWFPKGMGAVSERFGTPHVLLIMLYLVGLTPVIFNIPIGMIASSVSAMGQLSYSLVIVAALRFRYAEPELHRQSRFRLGLGLQWALTIVGVVICVLQALLLATQGVSHEMLWVLAVCVVLFLGWGVARYPTVLRIAENGRQRGVNTSTAIIT